MKNYYNTVCIEGIGSDINWCGRHRGGKRCLYCRRHAKFEEWSKDWKWNYLLEWNGRWPNGWRERSYYKTDGVYEVTSGTYSKYVNMPVVYSDSPDRYWTIGVSELKLKHLLKQGCKKNRKCKCINLIQRGSWYCPECFKLISNYANISGIEKHDLIIEVRNELKEKILIALLSGII